MTKYTTLRNKRRNAVLASYWGFRTAAQRRWAARVSLNTRSAFQGLHHAGD